MNDFLVFTSDARTYYLQKTLKLIFAVILAAGLGFTVLSVPSSTLASDNPYNVVFNERTTDSQNNTSTWSYTVDKTSEGPDLSHWIWEPCFSESEGERVVSTTPETQWVDSDGSTGHYGVKWNIEDGFEWDTNQMQHLLLLSQASQPLITSAL
ncbi:MAG TPA: hypothetical protein ENH66_03200 [Candidatus Nealsonbacteria bacterium]|nr:hypothetical protein [Candidatus Nealsonbacteria bacterium]